MQIKVLSEHVANQIAAGEVVERPSSVVKELVENSIDAKATKINIDIKNSNRSIRVADNGSGMSAEDIDLAFKRHATSKITNIEDLDSIVSNGFRGEALASISAVSKVTCISKRESDEHAHKLYLENGQSEKTVTGASNGTSILIDELFFNTPARLKFLKANTTERNEIIDAVRSLAIAHPEVAFTLNIDSKNVVKSTGSNNLKTVIADLFSNDVAKSLNEIQYHTGDIEIKGFCSSPHVTRSDKRGIFTILNNRSIKCHVSRSAIEAVYKDLTPKGKYPFAVLVVTMPQENVDVNVHPTKKEVKYKDGNKVYTTIGEAVAKTLSARIYEDHQKQADYQVPLEMNKPETTEQADHKSLFTNTVNVKPELEAKPNHNVQTQAQNTESKNLREETSEQEEKLESTAKKFVSRLGSVDISITNKEGLETVVSQQGNKTTFEIATSKEGRTAVLRGDFVGENWLKDKYLEFLHGIAEEVLQENLDKDNEKIHGVIEDKFAYDFGAAKKTNSSRPNKKPSKETLEKIWARDNYSCVYCGKALLHPDTVKEALKIADSEAFKTYLNKQNKEVTINLIDEHTATYDHHLPASKFPSLNTEEKNLYASCIACNKEKSNSLASKTWNPVTADTWADHSEDKPLKVGGVKFISAKKFLNKAS